MSKTNQRERALRSPRKDRSKVEWVTPKDPATGKDLEPRMVQEAVSRMRVNESLFQLSRRFIEDCRVVGTARLGQGVPSDKAGFYVAELGAALAECIEELVRSGDVQVARRLPVVVERLTTAQKRYGMKVSARYVEQHTIESLLKKHPAKELLAVALAKEPTLGKRKGWKHWPAFLAMEEAELRALLTAKIVIAPDQKPQTHPLADFIVRLFNLGGRGFERPNINLFVEWLYRGWLWSGPGATFEKCPWFGEKEKLPRSDTKAWMKQIRDFLRERTGNDVSKLRVFDTLLARRQAKYAKIGYGKEVYRLRDDRPEYALGVVMDEIEEAWRTLANKESGKKRKARKAG
jgi:hypothetical protein